MTREVYVFLSLQMAGIIVGVLLIGSHLYALLRPQPVQEFLRNLPRHKEIGYGLMALNFLWTYWLVTQVDLGEFYTWEGPLKIIVPVGFVLVILFVDEFLAARAVGMFVLLLACPILEAAFQKEPATRLLLPVLAYIWIVLGLFWVGMPYTLRDQITWASKTKGRWSALSIGGIVYGVAILVCAFVFWGGSDL